MDSGYFSNTGSVASDRILLFGEIDTAANTKGVPSKSSVCNLILSSSSTFLRFWLNDGVRDALLDHLDPTTLTTLRLVCHDFSGKVSPRLFSALKIPFTASALTRPSRIASLERIGHHVNSLQLTFRRNADSLLPPLINVFGDETSLNYRPQASPAASAAAKYGSNEIADLLVKQYPPLFHSSTNVPAFIRALNALPKLRKLIISCPTDGVATTCRSTVDFALISLRMAIERASLPLLNSISYSPISPSGLFYMQPLHGFGGTPASVRRWAQIKHMSIDMESSSVCQASRADQLKTLHNYLRNFAGFLTTFYFKWHGEQGPSPMSLDTEPGIFDHHPGSGRNRQPRSDTAIRFTALHQLDVQNAEVDASQISAFISQHCRTLEEFRFESIKFRTGDWDEALSPLAKWRRSLRPSPKTPDAMEVPLILSPVNLKTVKTVKTPTVNIREVIEGDLTGQSQSTRQSGFQKWLTRSNITRAKEQLRGGSEQVKTLLRRSIPWNDR